MTESEVAYWGAMAQVVPVLGVGLVLEIRILANRPMFKKSKVYRRAISLLWTFAAACMAIALSTALGSLRTNQPPGNIADLLSRGGLIYAASAVLISPVLDLIVVGNSDIIGRLFAASPKRWLVSLSLLRATKQLGAGIASHRSSLFVNLCLLDKLRDLLARQIDNATEVKAFAASIGSELPNELRNQMATVHDRVASLEVELAEVTVRRNEAHARWRAQIRDENNYKKWCEYALPRILGAIKNDVSRLADFLAASQVAQAGGDATPVYLPASQTTDDGGFIIEIPPQRLATWRDIPYLVRDVNEFQELEAQFVEESIDSQLG